MEGMAQKFLQLRALEISEYFLDIFPSEWCLILQICLQRKKCFNGALNWFRKDAFKNYDFYSGDIFVVYFMISYLIIGIVFSCPSFIRINWKFLKIGMSKRWRTMKYDDQNFKKKTKKSAFEILWTGKFWKSGKEQIAAMKFHETIGKLFSVVSLLHIWYSFYSYIFTMVFTLLKNCVVRLALCLMISICKLFISTELM